MLERVRACPRKRPDVRMLDRFGNVALRNGYPTNDALARIARALLSQTASTCAAPQAGFQRGLEQDRWRQPLAHVAESGKAPRMHQSSGQKRPFGLITSALKPLHREGYRFVAVFVSVTIAAFFVSDLLGWIGIVLTAWCYYFFRDPERVTPLREGLVVSPADGLVSMIEAAVPPAELGMGTDAVPRISVFMNVFDCHVNRFPIDGTVEKIAYRPGKFFNASLDKASVDNERNSLSVRLSDGRRIAVVQIAGLIARRICCDVTEGAHLATGERFGIIRFGSRLDVYLPEGVMPLVAVGQSAVAGETVLADLHSQEPARLGAVR